MRYAPLVPFVTALFLVAPFAPAQADNPQEPRKPDLPEIQPLWGPYQAALKAVAVERDKKLANLDNIYLLNLDRMKKERAEAVDLDGALAVKAEMDRLGAHQATSEEQRQAMAPALRALRGSYDAALKGYLDEAARGDEAALQKYLVDLEGLQKRITMTGDLKKALAVYTEKERIAAEAAKGRAAPVSPPALVTPAPVPGPVKIQPVVTQPPVPQPFKFGNVPIAGASKERPFENSLGMKFVPVPGTGVLFCIWETRMKDYAHFAREKKVNRHWQNTQRAALNFGGAPEHPVSQVSWEDAKAFCEWLTKKEAADGKLPKGAIYRLPTDEEWSRAVGLPNEVGSTPKERWHKLPGFPWGDEWPPKNYAGNYADAAYRQALPKEGVIEGYTDGFAGKAPVGSFAPNQFGIHDMGGNVAEMCEDLFEPGVPDRVVRDIAWHGRSRIELLSSLRRPSEPTTGGHYVGFRCVIAVSAP